jgi:glutamate carboxypeptidase
MMTLSRQPSTEDMLTDLRALVEVESPSRDLPALQASAKVVGSLIERRLGGAVEIVDSTGGPHVRWSGGGEPQVLVLGHHDTVFPLGTLARRPFRVADGKATGPGVFDMLGGLVQAIHGLSLLEDRSGIEILVTADEEVGSHSSRALLEELAVRCGAVLVFEGAADGGRLKTSRKGCGTFQVRIAGCASHAGLDPSAGVNALVEAAHQVLAIAAIGRPEIGTTVTPTVAHAGTLDNVVPAEATIIVDVRVESNTETERVEAALASLTPHVRSATLAIEGRVGRPPMHEQTSTELFEMARDVLPHLEAPGNRWGSLNEPATRNAPRQIAAASHTRPAMRGAGSPRIRWPRGSTSLVRRARAAASAGVLTRSR